MDKSCYTDKLVEQVFFSNKEIDLDRTLEAFMKHLEECLAFVETDEIGFSGVLDDNRSAFKINDPGVKVGSSSHLINRLNLIKYMNGDINYYSDASSQLFSLMGAIRNSGPETIERYFGEDIKFIDSDSEHIGMYGFFDSGTLFCYFQNEDLKIDSPYKAECILNFFQKFKGMCDRNNVSVSVGVSIGDFSVETENLDELIEALEKYIRDNNLSVNNDVYMELLEELDDEKKEIEIVEEVTHHVKM